MENHRCEEIHETLMKISCCDKCPEELKKKLQRLQGVDEVVFVETDVRTTMQCPRRVKLLGKEELQREKQRERVHKEEKAAVVEEEEEEEEEAPHICEAPKIDERYCRYLHCKHHPRSSRPINGMKLDDASLSFSCFPPLIGGPSMSFNGYHQQHYGPPAHQQHLGYQQP